MNLDELQSLYDFKDRTVLVTGGTGGWVWKLPARWWNAMLMLLF